MNIIPIVFVTDISDVANHVGIFSNHSNKKWLKLTILKWNLTKRKKYHTNKYKLHDCITNLKNITSCTTHIIEIYFTLSKNSHMTKMIVLY